jgi:hypothetical protein
LKLCFIVAENAICFGEVYVLDIGLSDSFLQSVNAYTLVAKKLIAAQLMQRMHLRIKGLMATHY